MPNQLHWINALSTRPSLEAAVTEVVEQTKKSLSGKPDLGIVFISSAYASDYPRLMPLLLECLSIPVVIGCGGGGIVGIDTDHQPQEIEANPALSLSVACLPDVEVNAFYLSGEQLPDLDSSPDTWTDLVGVAPEKKPHFILLCDPFFAKINDLLAGFDFAYPSSPKVGGLASSSSMGGQEALFYHSLARPGQLLYREGTVGVALSGNIVLETIVAQGCRPIGQPFQVLEGDRNVILALGDEAGNSRPPLEMLRMIIDNLSENDRLLAQNSLFVGIARDEFKLELTHGDFLIRNLLGVDPRSGAIALGDRVRPGQRIQFHLRDAQTSADDLKLLLATYQGEKGNLSAPMGALLFSCLGRGERLYNKPNFDSNLFRNYLDHIPLGGFFCNGEIGPVGGSTFLHGYTSVFGIFRKPRNME